MEVSDKSNTSVIEQVAKAVTLLYAFLVFCGSLYLYFYYITFNIEIFKYVDLSEISVAFLHILVPTILFIVFLSGYFFGIKTLTELKFKKRADKPSPKWFSKLKELLSIFNKVQIDKVQSVWIIIALITCSMFLFISWQKLSTSMNFSTYRDDFWGYFVSICIFLIILKYNLRFIVINTAIVFVMASVYNAVGDVKDTLEKAKNNTFIIITDNDTIKTNEKFYYVGRTQEYVFFFNSVDNSNTYIPMSEIKGLLGN